MTPPRTSANIDTEAWRSAIKADAFASYHAEMGRAVLKEGNIPAAVEHFRQALGHDPRHRVAQVRLVATLCQHSENATAAQQAHAAAIAVDPLYEPRGHCLIALEAMEAKQWEASEQALSEAERLAPGLPEAAFCRRLLAIARGRGEGPDAPPPSTTGVSPDIAWNIVEEALSLSFAAFVENRFSAMVEVCRLALALDPDCSRADAQLGRGLTRLGRQEEAAAAFERAVAREGEQADLLWWFAECLMRLPEGVDRAASLFERAAALNPDSPLIHASRIHYLLQRGRFAEAIRLDQSRLERNPTDMVTRGRLAVGLLRAGQANEAVTEFRHCLKSVSNPFLNAYLGLALLAAGDVSAAVTTLEQALQQKAGDAWISSCLGLARQADGAPDQALTLQRHAAQTDGSAWVQITLGLALAATGNREGALAAWRSAAEQEPWNLFYYFSLVPTFRTELLQGFEEIGFTTSSPFWPDGQWTGIAT
ncbi:tetratricopeptide repeat protein [Azospirillum brasilense]|uniref:tetratricopeptide repeat protein n=1 Tax=Azospirillum brasilense TaxID=192 RepID=UPI000E0A241A|nr:tetratricopeptide repeat protein [Azospirillum brasilense]